MPKYFWDAKGARLVEAAEAMQAPRARKMPRLDSEEAEAFKRPTASQRGYDAKWRILRAAFLKKHPRCKVCGERATDVDHIVPRSRGGSDKWANLQPLCSKCHKIKTGAHDMPGRGERGCDEHGWPLSKEHPWNKGE